MATRQSTVDFLIDQLAALRTVTARKMFGEYGVFFDGRMVMLVCDDQIFVKNTAAGAALLDGRFTAAPPYPGAKPALLLGDDVLEDRELLCRLIKTTAQSLALPALKKPRQRKQK